MSLQWKEKVFNITTLTADVPVTGIGFTHKAAIFIAVGRTEAVDTGGNQTGRQSLGFSVQTTQGGGLKHRAVAAYSEHNAVAGSTNSMRQYQATDASILFPDSSSIDPIDGKARVKSWDADGVTLEILEAFTADVRVLGIFLGGSDLLELEIVDLSSPTTGTTPFTTDHTTGFTCANKEALGLVIAGSHDTDNDTTADSDLVLGAFTSPTEQMVVAAGTDQAQTPTQAQSHGEDAQCFVNFSANINTLQRRAKFDSWITNGFRWTWNEIHAESKRAYVLVIKGGKWSIKSGATAASLTTVALTGAGFAPVGGLLASVCQAEHGNDAVGDHAQLALGAFSGAASRAAMTLRSTDAVSTTVVATRIEHDACYAQIDGAGAAVGLMDVQSLDSDGVTFVMDDADPSAAWFGAVLAGSASVGGGSATGGAMRRRRRR